MPAHNPIKAALTRTPACLSLQQLEGLVSAPQPSHPHLAECPRCQAELALLKQFESSEPLPDEGAAVAWIGSQLERRLDQIKNPSRTTARAGALENGTPWLSRIFGSGRLRVLVPVMATLAVAVTVVVLLRPAKEPELRADRGQGSEIFRSQEIETVGPTGALSQAPAQVEWKPVVGAARYRVSLMEIDHSPLWSHETGENTAPIPASVRAKMLGGKPLLWQVTALDLQGKIVASSQLQRVFVSPK